MIKSKQDYKYYCKADDLAMGISSNKTDLKLIIYNIFFLDYRRKYQKLMRKLNEKS